MYMYRTLQADAVRAWAAGDDGPQHIYLSIYLSIYLYIYISIYISIYNKMYMYI